MYKIYKDGELVWTNETPDVGIYSAKLTLEANNTNSLEINVAKTSNAFSNLKMLQSIIQVYQDDETDPIFEGRPISKKVDYQGNADYKFEGALGYLYDSIQPPVDYTGLTPETILKALIKEHNSQVEPYKQFTVGDVTIIDNTESDTYTGVGRLHDDDADKDPAYIYQYDSNKTGINQSDLTTGYESTFDAINNLLINNLHGNLVVRFQNGIKYLDYLEKYLPSEGQVILFGSNLLDFSSTLDYSSICTGVLPLGYSRGSDDYEPGDPNNPDDPSNIYQKEDDPLQTVKSKLTIESVNNGSKILWDQNMVNTYGRIVKAVEWSNCKDANKLLDKAKAYLYKKQYDNLALECKIIDLHFVNTDSKPLHHMHMVEVMSEPHSLDRMMPINKMDLDLMNPANDTISLGQTYNSITGELANTKDTITQVKGQTANNSTTISNNAKTNYTNFTQTDNAITLEAHKRDEAIKKNYDAVLKITADQISSEVSARKDGEEALSSRITQTAGQIQSTVRDNINNLQTQITQNSNEISTKVSNGEFSSKWQQEASGFTIDADHVNFNVGSYSIDASHLINLSAKNLSIKASDIDFSGYNFNVLNAYGGVTIQSGGNVQIPNLWHGDGSEAFVRYDKHSGTLYYTDTTNNL